MFQKIITMVFLYLNVDVGEGEMLVLVYSSALSLTEYLIQRCSSAALYLTIKKLSVSLGKCNSLLACVSRFAHST